MIMFSDCHWIYLLPLFLGIICQSDRLSVRLWHCIQNGCTYHRRGMRNSCDHNTCVRTVWSRWMLTHNVGICDGLPSCLSVNERCPILRCLTRSMRACVRYANTCIPDAAKSYPIKLKGSVKEPNKFHIYETEKITLTASDAAEYIELFGSFTRDRHARWRKYWRTFRE